VLTHYDGFKNLFGSLAQLHGASVQLGRYIGMRRERTRGLRLISRQTSLLQLQQQFEQMDSSLCAALGALRKASAAFIHSIVSVRALDAKYISLT
jgi:hypothetical protein